jgi:hypothetical protein
MESCKQALDIYLRIFGFRDCRVSHLLSQMVKIYFDLGNFADA